MQQGGISVAAIYCNRCGCENTSDRGACVRCLNLLQWPPEGNICDNCGADNAGHAEYCFNCCNPFGGAEPADDWSMAAAINLALGGDADIGPAEDEYMAEEEPEAVPDLDFEESSSAEEAEAPEPPMFEPAEAEEEEFAPPPPPPEDNEPELLEVPPTEEEAEEEPGGVDSEFAPLSAEDLAPEAAEDELESLALELASEPEEAEEAAPPPPPPDALEIEEITEEEPETAEPAEPAEAAEDDEDSVLGGWALEIDDE